MTLVPLIAFLVPVFNFVNFVGDEIPVDLHRVQGETGNVCVWVIASYVLRWLCLAAQIKKLNKEVESIKAKMQRQETELQVRVDLVCLVTVNSRSPEN